MLACLPHTYPATAQLSPAAWPGRPGGWGGIRKVGRMNYSCARSHPQIIQYSALSNLFQRYLYSSSRSVKKAAK